MTTTRVLPHAPGLRTILALGAGILALFICLICGLAIFVPPGSTRIAVSDATLGPVTNSTLNPLSTPTPPAAASLIPPAATITATLPPPANTATAIPIPLPVITFTASQTNITAGASVFLTWSVLNADTVFLNQEKVDSSGTRSVTTDTSTTLQIFAANAAGNANKSITINVQKLADLAVTDISLASDNSIAYSIVNLGAGDATRPFMVRVTANGKEVEWDRPISMLAAGQKATMKVPNYTVVGTQNVEVRVNLLTQDDPESNYNNNALSQVLAGPPPVPGSLGGTVMNSRLKAPVDSAKVAITGPTTQSATTASTGLYSFLSIPTGSYNVNVTRSGYLDRGDTRSVMAITNTFDYALTPCVNITDHKISPTTQITDTTITLSYTLNNACPVNVPVYLGGRIRKNGTTLSIVDPSGDTQVSVPASSIPPEQTRLFTIPATTTVGLYDVEWTIWEAKAGASLRGKYDESGFNDNLNKLRVCPRLASPTLKLSELGVGPVSDAITATQPVSITLQWDASGGCPPYDVNLKLTVDKAPVALKGYPESRDNLSDTRNFIQLMPLCPAPNNPIAPTTIGFSLTITDTVRQVQSASPATLNINWKCPKELGK